VESLYDRNLLEASLSQMESQALNFAQRFINDSQVRMSYIKQTKKLSEEYRLKVKSGALTASKAAKQVQEIRNHILEAHRLKTSDIGKSVAVKLKQNGLTLAELTDKYAHKKFNASFANLSPTNQKSIYLEIIESADRARPSMNALASKYSKLGRGLIVVTLGAAVYNITFAENKARAVAREGAIIGGGFIGAAAGGSAAGLACGPAAPFCVTLGVFVGGALAALSTDLTCGWLF
jgi:hypothetical protein